MIPRRAWTGLVAGLLLGAAARGQLTANPVYADTSPTAQDTLSRIGQFVGAGNVGEAAREAQRLLEEHADRMVAAPEDPDLFVSVRARVHQSLLRWPELLERYRSNEEATARGLLESGTLEAARRVETARLMTAAGLEAALRVARDQLETARFEAARLTLEQLEWHPDRATRENGERCAQLMLEVSRYLPTPQGRRAALGRAERWAGQAGMPLPLAHSPAERPPGVDSPVYSLDSGAAVQRPVPGAPLWTTQIDPTWSAAPAQPNYPSAEALAADESRLWVVPSVAGDTLYTNDGTTITARDRFTLQARWSTRPAADRSVEDPDGVHGDAAMRGAGRALEDVNTVTVAGRIVLATTGLARDGLRSGDPRTHALDAATGRVLWSVDVAGLDPQLESGSTRGPVMVEADTVVVSVRKAALIRRVVSVYLVGLSLRTGELRWVRLVGSAGALPFVQQKRIGDAPVLDQGVVYIQDQLGLAGAVEAATGRAVWMRRMPVARSAEQSTMPWRWGEPILDREAMTFLAPNQADIFRVDRSTGAMLASRPAGPLGDPAYLVRIGDWVAAVGQVRIALLPLDDIAGGRVAMTRPVPTAQGSPGIRGRVVPAGDRLLVPRIDGFTLIDPENPGGEGEFHPLDETGNALPAPSQLLVLDGVSVHSYLAWPVAHRLLSERMRADPGDPVPAITYAELAYRAGQPQEIAGAADKALAALAGASENAGVQRARLFASLRSMVDASQGIVRPGAPAVPPLDLGVLSAVIERLGKAAQSPQERVAHLMALGRLRESEDKPGVAVAAYQQVLADPRLGAALWDGASLRVRADLEASRRVRRLVAGHGKGVYEAFDAEAEFAAGALGESPAPGALEAVARRYPGAAQNAALWLRIAGARERAGERHASVRALREGLAAAELALSVGQAVAPEVPGEIAGRLLTALRDLDQVTGAARVLERVARELPGVSLTRGGTPVDVESLGAELLRGLAASTRLPRLGPEVEPEVQVLEGWAVMDPVSREKTAAEHVMLVSPTRSMVALWGAPAAALPAGEDGRPERLAMLWSRPYEGIAPILVRLEAGAAYLLWDRQHLGSALEKIDAVTGRTVWSSAPHTTYFAADAAWQLRASATPERIDTPLDQQVRPLDVMVTFDAQSVVLADRTGRVACFDAAVGGLRWSVLSGVWHVHDLDAAGGLVVVGGVSPPEENPGAQVGLRPLVECYEVGTGRVTRNTTDLTGAVRWLRVAGAGEAAASVIVALEAEIVSLDPATGGVNWAWAGGGAFNSLDAWVFGDALFVLSGGVSEERSLWLISAGTGLGGDRPLETFQRVSGAWPVAAAAIPGPRGDLVAFLTGRGVLVYDPGRALGPGADPGTPALVGIDALGQAGVNAAMDPTVGGPQLVLPAASESYFVALESWPSRLPDQRLAFALHFLDSRSGKLQGPSRQLVLWDTPRRVVALDGRLVVSSGSARAITLVYGTPPVDSPPVDR